MLKSPCATAQGLFRVFRGRDGTKTILAYFGSFLCLFSDYQQFKDHFKPKLNKVKLGLSLVSQI